jgi:type III secretory pathway component EscV
MQTDAENAEIVKSKKQLVIVPETYGFRTNTAYVTEQLNKQLVTLENPTVNLSAVTDRPAITQADLQDDIETARRLIATNVGVQAYKTVIRPSDDQKLSWLDIQQVPGTNQVQLQFSQAKVREYVFEIAKKYNTEAVAEQLTTNPDGTQTVQAGKAGSVVANVDDVANALYKALSNQQSQVIAFTINPVDYQKVDRSQVQMTQTTTAAATTTNQSGSLSQATAQQAIAGVN